MTWSNKCTRCGNERVIAESWEEEVQTSSGSSLVKHQKYICNDSKCQQKVDDALNTQKMITLQRAQEAQARADARAVELAKSRKKPKNN